MRYIAGWNASVQITEKDDQIVVLVGGSVIGTAADLKAFVESGIQSFEVHKAIQKGVVALADMLFEDRKARLEVMEAASKENDDELRRQAAAFLSQMQKWLEGGAS